MSNVSPGDVGIEVTLNEQQAVDGAKRTAQALDELNQIVLKVGTSVTKAMEQSAAAIVQATEATRKMTAEQAAAHDAARKAYDEHARAVAEQKSATDAAAGALDTFRERLAAINSERARAFGGMGAQLAEVQKQLTTAQLGGDTGGSAQAQQRIIAMNREVVQAQRDALAEMARDEKLSDAEHEQVKQAQLQAEHKLRDLDVANHRAAETAKVAATKQAAQEVAQAAKQQADAEKQAAQAAVEAARQRQQALQDLKQGLMQIGVAAAAMSYAIKKAMDEALDAFKQQQRAFAGLDAIASAYGQSTSKAKEAAKSLTADGILPLGSAVAALRDLLTAGLNVEQAQKMLEIFKDRAAIGRAETVSFSQAVENLGQAFKTEQSRLGDLSGMTENFSRIIEVGARQMGKQVSQLTDAERAQAKYLGILQLSAGYAGGLAKMSDTLSIAEDRAANSTIQLKVAVGEALAPAMQNAQSAMLPLLQSATGWAQQNPELARTIILVAGGAAALTATVAGLTVAILAFHAAVGPVGWVLVGLSIAFGGLGGLATSLSAGADAAGKQMRQLDELVTEYNILRSKIDDITTSTDDRKRAEEKLKAVLEDVKKINPDLVSGLDLQTEALKRHNDELGKSVAKWEGFKAGLVGFLLSQGQSDWAKAIAPEFFKGQTIAPEEFGQPSGWSNIPKDRSHSGGVGGGGGLGTGSQMSAALKAAMEDLQDLQALDKTPEHLKATLEKVRQILRDHGAELKTLEKDRDLVRLRDFTLPKEITQAEFTEVMRQLQHDEQLAAAKGKPLDPNLIKARLEAVKQQFAAYLAEHPDAAASIDVRLAGMDQEQAKKAVQDALQIIENQKKLLGDAYGPGQERADLARIIPLASTIAGEEGLKQVVDLIGRLNQLDTTIQKAAFDRKFKAISDARESAFAGAAGALAEMQKALADEETKGSKANPARVAAIKQQMLDAVKPAIEAQKAALEQLLLDTALTTDQRERIERELTSVKAQLYQQDVDAHRLALDAKVAAEKAAAQTLQDLRSALRAAQQADLEQLKQQQTAEEKAQAARVKGLEKELAALEKKWAAEDRLKRQKDLQTELDNVKADTRFEVIGPDGKPVITYDTARAAELERQIADQKQQDDRQRQRDSLQGQIQTEQQRLDAMRTAHQQAYTERQNAWQQLLALDDAQLAELVKQTDLAMGDGENGWYGVFSKWLNQAVSTAQEKAASITSALQDAINKAREAQAVLNGGSAAPGATQPPGAGDSTTPASRTHGHITAFGHGGVAGPENPVFGVFGERVREYNLPEDYIGELAARIVRSLPRPSLPGGLAAPTLPASLGAATGGNTYINLGGIQITVKGGTDPQATAAAVEPAAARGVQQGLTAAGFNQTIRKGIRTV